MTNLQFEVTSKTAGKSVTPLPVRRGQDRAPLPCESPKPSHANAVIDCGWGRLLYAPSFDNPSVLAQILMQEEPGKRDIALHVNKPQLVLAEAPANLFLDPSIIFRRTFDKTQATYEPIPDVLVRGLSTRADIAAINRLYMTRGMVAVDSTTVWDQRNSASVVYLIAEDQTTGEVIGSVMAVDHAAAFGDEQNGSSLWCLVVDPQTSVFGTGQVLVNHLTALLIKRGRKFMDLSVLHNNEPAIALYQKLGFESVPGFVVKHKNAINERLFVNTDGIDGLNPYARLIVDEARRRGIGVDAIDVDAGIFTLRYCGQEYLCRESLTELTGGVAMSWCQDKVLTLRRLSSAGLAVPRQQVAGDEAADARFLRECGAVVVKPALGEQGRGISVDIRSESELPDAIQRAAAVGGHVVIEQFCPGQDLRIVVIGYKVVAAAIRRPAEIVGNGESTIALLIERQSARRSAATDGESCIPVDAETVRCLASQGLDLESIPENGRQVQVRKTANLHTGGTIHDVTDLLHPTLRDAAETAARALHIPVVGLDFLVDSPDAAQYVLIEANERPGLANHEPQPTAKRFIDLLFPLTA